MSVHRFPERDASNVLPAVEVVDRLPAEALVDFATHAAALHARAMARLALVPAAPAAPSGGDEMLTAAEAAPLLGVSEDWVRRNGGREGLAVRIGRRTVRYSRAAITRYAKRRAIG